MTLAENKSFARVVVIAPRTRVDVALPIDVPVVDLLPLLLELVGERSDDGGSEHGGWQLSRVGAGELTSDRTLRSLEIFDGTALHLAPRESAAAPPIFDDTVDAIASTVREGMSLRSTNPAAGAAAAAVGLAVAALTMLYRGGGTANTTVAIAVTLVALGIGAAIARGPGARIVATALTAGGLPFAFVSGLDIVPGHVGRSGVLLGFALMLAYAILAVAALGTGTVVFVAATIVSVFGTGAALVATVFDVKALYCVAGACSLGVAAVAVLPWLVVRVARLPLPLIPTSTTDIRSAGADVDIDEVISRARLADEFLNGSIIGCALVVVFGSAVVAQHQSVLAILLAVACVGALLLRVRGLAGLVPRLSIIAISLTGILAGGAVQVAGRAHNDPALVAAALAVAAAGVLFSVVLPRVRVSPVTRRFVDFIESVVLISILPLAVGVMNLYSTMRHL